MKLPIASVTSGLQSNSRNDPWINAYQNILDGGISKPSKRMSMPAVPSMTKPQSQSLVIQKHCNGCYKQIFQAKVFVEPGKPSIIYCEKCYIEKFTKGSCPTCTKPVLSKTDPYITHNKRTWHAVCFKCFKCHVDVASRPMVDLRGRPCCEECLMAQAGAENQSPSLQDQDLSTFRDSPTPGNRSAANSPALSSSPLPANTRTSNSPYLDASLEIPSRLQPNLSPLDINLDRSHMQTSPPLSAQSTSSQSSLGASSSFRNAGSSGYTSGTSSTYSSLGHSDGGFKSNDETDTPGKDQGLAENMSESTLHGLHRARSHSTPSADNRVDQYPTSSVDANLVAPTEKLSLSPVERPQPKAEPSTGPQRPIIGRARSRTSVGPAPSASVRARTQAYMNQAKSGSSPTRSNSQMFGSSQNLTVNRASSMLNHPSKQETSPSAAASSEAESKRPSLQRHGRQRSSTVGEAVSFPSVNVDSPVSPSLWRASIPENHCLKCLEKVTENGVRLQNGDRYHISCFLCHGCKQVFTESEFHVVLGRPYHPSCVSMAGPSSAMSALTKCQQCHKVITGKSIRFAGLNYHTQCFACTHCNKALTSTSRFFEVEGRVECEQCCDERDNASHLPPKIVPVPRAAEHFPMPVIDSLSRRASLPMEPSGPGMMATNANGNLSRSGSGSGCGSPVGSASPLRSPASPSGSTNNFLNDVRDQTAGSGAASPVLVMPSPLAERATPPVLTSFFGTRTRPLPKFGGVTTCPRCHLAVSVMEQVPGPKNEKWHKKCLNCTGCKKVLDSSALTRGEGEAFCRACFNKTRGRV
ncbi:hypothetical protein BGZ54_005924 [Gamsiella multidivaricata]|nr:hypothetical protein BGZ54_005924 [Gamsiella multidivaricata]